MKTLIVGCKGQLGTALASTATAGPDVIGKDIPDLDITDVDAVVQTCRDLKPRVIINTAAYTAVDRAESEQDLAHRVNVTGVQNLVAGAGEVGARLIHISTDFVFDGEIRTPYRPEDKPNPLGVYGKTKREGELAVLQGMPESGIVVRTAWLYSKTANNFVKTMLKLMQERDEISVVADQIGTPTWANSLAEVLWGLTNRPDTSGIFHWTDGGQASWHEFATAIQEEALALGLLQSAIPIRAIPTTAYPTPAQRPQYSVLDCTKTHEALGSQPVDWRVNLKEMLKGMVT
jgi:dTDP-4-dehydrorhamnose reductase